METESPTVERVAPHAPEIESAVLATWLADSTFARSWKPEPELFHVLACRHIAEAAAKLDPAKRNETMLLEQLRRDGTADAAGGRAGLSKITLCAELLQDPHASVETLRELSMLRGLIASMNAATVQAYASRDLSATMATVRDAMTACSTAGGLRMLSVRDLFGEVARRALERVGQVACPTGIAGFDRDIGGLVKGMITIVGADTNVGKSSLVTMISDEAMKRGNRVMLISFEDGAELWGRRIMQRRIDVPALRLRDMCKLSDQEQVAVLAAADAAERTKFFLNADGIDVDRIANKITAECMAEKFDLVIVDYLQKIETTRYQQDRRNQLSYIARRLTSAIKGAGAAGLLVSQVSRPEKGKAYKPSKHDLKESGDIENGAENVAMIYECKQGERHLVVVKAKDAPGHKDYPLSWSMEHACFLGEATSCTCAGGSTP